VRRRRRRRCARALTPLTPRAAHTTHSFWNTDAFKETRDAAEAEYAAAKAAHDELVGRPTKRKAVDGGAGAGGAKKAKLALTGDAFTLVDIDGADWVRDAEGRVRRLTGPVYASAEAVAAAAAKAKAAKAAGKAAKAANTAAGSEASAEEEEEEEAGSEASAEEEEEEEAAAASGAASQ
jgi:hypothetical protein